MFFEQTEWMNHRTHGYQYDGVACNRDHEERFRIWKASAATTVAAAMARI
jgi:hypothetical protein